MKKTYKLIDLDCANCAAKMEAAINKLKGVASASVSFMAQKLTVKTEDAASIADIEREIVRVCQKIEPDCKIAL